MKPRRLLIDVLAAVVLSVAILVATSSPKSANAGPPISGSAALTYPWPDCFAITTSDTTDFAVNARCVYVGTGGDVVAVMQNGTVATFKNVPSGTFLPILAKRINATSTTAADMLGGK